MKNGYLTSIAALPRFLFCLGSLIFIHGACAADAITKQQQGVGLAQLIAQSIQNHPSVAAAEAQHGAAQAEVGTARAQYYPTPSVQVLNEKGQSSTVLALQQPLWAGGRIDAGLDAAQSRANATQIAISAAQYTLALRVTAAWAAWVQAHVRSEVLDKGVVLLNVYAESVNRRIAGGISGNADRELVIARVMQTQGDLDFARSSQRSALARLVQLTGQPLRAQDLATVSDGDDLAVSGYEILVDTALTRSAALKRLDADIQTALHEARQKRAALWPTVNLRLQHQQNENPALSSNNSQVLVVMDYSPGAGLSASTSIAAADARVLGLRESLDATRRDLTETIAADFEDYQSSSDRARSIQRAIKSCEQVLASYDRLFVAGKQSWLDVMNAARELIQVQATLADVDAQRIAARARLRLHAGEMM